MAVVKMVQEDKASVRVKELYSEIKETLGIDFVPNMYKVMAAKPSILETNWEKVKTIMVQPGKLDRMTREIIAVAVSATMGCDY
jgi:alkylhydroperoxidase/carboxymuconolactone decarboxylase family protein YurZ